MANIGKVVSGMSRSRLYVQLFTMSRPLQFSEAVVPAARAFPQTPTLLGNRRRQLMPVQKRARCSTSLMTGNFQAAATTSMSTAIRRAS
jgi:hypothetical protein